MEKKPSKHDVLAHVWQYVHYVEDFIITTPRKNFDMSVLREKNKQVKRMLKAAEGR